jgi:hypothetical protein
VRNRELYLNSGSGAFRWIVTVPAAAFAETPPLSVHVAGVFRHASEPTIPA